MKVGVSLFMQNYTDWDRYEAIEHGGTITRPRVHDSQIYADDLRLGRMVEPLGFDSLWSVEHHFTPYTMVPDVLKLLTFYAGCTEQIEMGTMVIVLPWHDPLRVAEGVAMLDNMLAGRRLSIGFGRGLGRREFGGLRIPMEESRDRFLEALDVVRLALTEEWFSYDGEYYKIPRTTLRPQPLSDAATLLDNMYCAWGSPQTIPIAAKTGLKALFIPQTTWEDYAVQMAQFRDLRAASGFAPAHPTCAVWVYCAPTEDEAWDGASRYIPEYADSVRRHYEIMGEHFETTKGYEHYAAGSRLLRESGNFSMGDTYLKSQVWGTPEQCIEKFTRINELMGPDHFVAIVRYGSMPPDRAEASMRLFAKEVLPVLQQLAPATVAEAPAARA
jgi:alkanesulfonate monooxygenase SsuD/methylene tetrahydromethanopterin reductase-like flavin-dependent oxidoreductase (luciferase family)